MLASRIAIRRRHILPLIVLVAFAFTAIVAEITRSQSQGLFAELQRLAERTASDLAARGEAGILSGNDDALGEELLRAVANPDVLRAAYLEPSGRVIESAGSREAPMLSIGEARAVGTAPVESGSYWMAAAPVVDDGGTPVGYAVVSVTSERMSAVLRKMAVRLLVVTLVSFAAVVWLATGLIKRIRELTSTLAQRVEDRTADLQRATEDLEKTALFAVLNPSPVVRFDAGGLIIWSNPASEAVGLQSSAARPFPLGAVLPGVDCAACVRESDTIVATTSLGNQTFQVTLRGSREQNCGHAYFTDITELKSIESALAAARDRALDANRLKSEFLANMSHEIRTPMNGVIGMLGLMEGTPLTALQREYLDVATTSGNTLLAIIGDILDLSKIESGMLELEHDEFDLRELVEGVAQAASGGAAESVAVHAFVQPNIPSHLVGDTVRLRQVLANLATNAVKFTPAGYVQVRAELFEHRNGSATIAFRVSDTGIGITPDIQQRLFNPFTQADSSTTRRFGGSGLGLSICQRLVRLMGGVIRVQSTVGLGSTFMFTLTFPTRALPSEGSQGALDGMTVGIDLSDEFVREAVMCYVSAAGGKCVVSGGSVGDCAALVRDVSVPATSGHPAMRTNRIVGIARTRGEAETRAGEFDAVITLPIRRAALIGALTGETPELRPALATEPSKRARALVADAHPIERTVTASILRNVGIDVTEAVSATEALEHVVRFHYDLIVVGRELPDAESGAILAQLQEVFAREGGRRLPVLQIVERDEPLEQTGVFDGVDRLSAPFEATELTDFVERSVFRADQVTRS